MFTFFEMTMKIKCLRDVISVEAERNVHRDATETAAATPNL